MLRTVLAAVTLGTASLVAFAPAAAANGDTTTVSKVGLPSGWQLTASRLDGKPPGDASANHVEGPARRAPRPRQPAAAPRPAHLQAGPVDPVRHRPGGHDHDRRADLSRLDRVAGVPGL